MNEMLIVHLLGMPEILLGSALFAAPGKAHAMLYYLIATRQPLSRAALAELLWPEAENNLGRRYLRNLLVGIRPKLGKYLSVNNETIAFREDSDTYVDLYDLATVFTLPIDGTTAQQVSSVLKVINGEFLKGFEVSKAPRYEEWLREEREYWHTRIVATHLRLAMYYAEQGETDTAVDKLGWLLRLDPWHEVAHQEMIRLLAQQGRRLEALSHFRHVSDLFTKELGIPVSQEIADLAEHVRSGDVGTGQIEQPNLMDDLPSISSATAPRFLAPLYLTPCLGRQEELATLSGLLVGTPHLRLVTLVGLGGIGKTRLATQFAHEVRNVFEDGVVMVSLESVTSADLLVDTIASALGCEFLGNVDTFDQLKRFLARKRLLLILDNYEQFLVQQDETSSDNRALDLISGFLTEAPELKILVTSRSPLGLRGEWQMPLSGLTFPDEAIVNIDTEGEYSAIDLFMQTAHRLNGRPLKVNKSEWPCLHKICHLVDGLPLGVELAASWTSILSCKQIVNTIEQNLVSLNTPFHDVPSRHSSLLAVFESTLTSLPEAHQRIFRQLAVFQGGCQVNAALSVVGDVFLDPGGNTPPVPSSGRDALFPPYYLRRRVLDALHTLIGRGLLRYTEDDTVFSFHPLLWHYAGDKLALFPTEAAQVRTRHAAYYLDQLGDPDLFDNIQMWVSAISKEYANVRAALTWQLEQEPEDALESVTRFYPYWREKGLFEEARYWILTCLERTTSTSKTRALAHAQGVEVTNALQQVELAERLLTEGTEIYLLLNDTSGLASVYEMRGWLCSGSNEKAEYEKTIEWFSKCLALYRNLNAPGAIVDILCKIAKFHRPPEHRYTDAHDLLDEALAIAIEHKLPQSIAECYLYKAFAAFHFGFYEEADAHYKVYSAFGVRSWDGFKEQLGAEIALLLGDLPAAEQQLLATHAKFKESARILGIATTSLLIGKVLRQQGRLEEAVTWDIEGLQIAIDIKDARVTARILADFGLIALATADYERAAYLLFLAQNWLDRLPPYLTPKDQLEYSLAVDELRLQVAPETLDELRLQVEKSDPRREAIHLLVSHNRYRST
ncbi:hypothetical protein GC175_11870 [bacterium]|nr:hypothetical protein [bacterium]